MLSRLHTSQYSYLLKEAALFIVLSLLIILNGSTSGLIEPTLQKELAVLITLPALAWVLSGQRAATPAGKALLVWVVIYSITVAFSVDPRRSFTQMELMSISIFLFALSADLVARGWQKELLIKVLLMVGTVVMLFGWLEALLWYLRWLQNAPGEWIPDIIYRPSSANVIAMFMNLMLMLSLARLLVTRRRLSAAILSVLALSAAGLLYLTSSRGGWLGSAAGLAMIALLSFRRYTGMVQKGWAYLRSHPALLGGLTAVLLLAASVGGVFLYRRTIHPSHGPLLDSRSEYWPPAWQTFLNHPLVGTGPLTYAAAFLGANSVPPKFLYVHAHGTPFNILAEMGLLGFLGMTLLVVNIILLLVRRLSFASGDDWGVVAGAAAALAATAVHSLFDGFHTEPIGLWVLVIALGAALGLPAKPAAARPWRFCNAWSLLLVLALWVEVWMAAPLHTGVALANSNQWEAAAASFSEAVTRDPASLINLQQRALANSMLAQKGSPEALTQAIQDFEVVVQREPSWPLNHADLGALYLSEGRVIDGVGQMAEAFRRAPDCGWCALNLGAAQEQAGESSAALESYQKALDLGQPDDAYFWRNTPLRSKALDAWLVKHPSKPLLDYAELVLEKKADSSNLKVYLKLIDLDLRENRLDEASALIQESFLAFSLVPQDQLERDWLAAELLARQGHLDEAVQQGQQVIDLYQMQGPYGPGSLGQLYYAPLLFRRPAMALELAPQVFLIALPNSWGARISSLADWYDQEGKPQQAADLRKQLQALIPDWSPAVERLYLQP